MPLLMLPMRACLAAVVLMMELSTGRHGWSPSISTGVYAYPMQQAAKIAIRTIRMMVDKHPEAFDEILWVLFDGRTKLTYDGALQKC